MTKNNIQVLSTMMEYFLNQVQKEYNLKIEDIHYAEITDSGRILRVDHCDSNGDNHEEVIMLYGK